MNLNRVDVVIKVKQMNFMNSEENEKDERKIIIYKIVVVLIVILYS